MSYQPAEAYLNDPDYRTPGTSRGFIDAFKKRFVLQLLTKKGMATRYYGSVLGWIWSYLRPGTQFLMYYIVIGIILDANRGIAWFPVYLFAGLTAVNLYSEILRNTTTSITDNKALIKKIFLPRELYALSAVTGAFVHFVPQMIILAVVVLLCGWTFSWAAILSLFAGLALIFVFSLGTGMFFGALNAFYRDANNFVGLILMFAVWGSPVMFSFEMMRDRAPEWLYHIYMANPVSVAVELFHNAFWLPLAPDSPRPENLHIYALIAVGISLLALLVGQFCFKKMGNNFAQRL